MRDGKEEGRTSDLKARKCKWELRAKANLGSAYYSTKKAKNRTFFFFFGKITNQNCSTSC